MPGFFSLPPSTLPSMASGSKQSKRSWSVPRWSGGRRTCFTPWDRTLFPVGSLFQMSIGPSGSTWSSGSSGPSLGRSATKLQSFLLSQRWTRFWRGWASRDSTWRLSLPSRSSSWFWVPFPRECKASESTRGTPPGTSWCWMWRWCMPATRGSSLLCKASTARSTRWPSVARSGSSWSLWCLSSPSLAGSSSTSSLSPPSTSTWAGWPPPETFPASAQSSGASLMPSWDEALSGQTDSGCFCRWRYHGILDLLCRKHSCRGEGFHTVLCFSGGWDSTGFKLPHGHASGFISSFSILWARDILETIFQGVFCVGVKEGQDLVKKDKHLIGGKSDPYVVLKVGESKVSFQVKFWIRETWLKKLLLNVTNANSFGSGPVCGLRCEPSLELRGTFPGRTTQWSHSATWGTFKQSFILSFSVAPYFLQRISPSALLPALFAKQVFWSFRCLTLMLALTTTFLVKPHWKCQRWWRMDLLRFSIETHCDGVKSCLWNVKLFWRRTGSHWKRRNTEPSTWSVFGDPS